MKSEAVPFSVGRVTRFFLPLLLQGLSQSLSYPLVAGIVTGSALGIDALTAFSQGLTVMFMIGSIGGGLITTGLVFARTWNGYVSFRRLNSLMMAILLVIQCLVALPPLGELIFEDFFALPPALAEVSRFTLVASVVMNCGFFIRNLPMVVLFNRLESGKANNATLVRLVVSVLCACLFPRWGWTGPAWGLAALTFGVWVETAITWFYARPYLRQLPNHPQFDLGGIELPPLAALTLEQFRFTLPLSLGGFLLALSPVAIAAFVARTADAGEMLAIHHVTLGVANPIAYAALKLQPVAVKFLPEYPGDRRLLGYAVVAGLVLGLIPLAFATPWLGHWYFAVFQHVPERILPTVRLVIGVYALIAVVHAVRARIEGIAAARRRPDAVMIGECAYTLALIAVGAALLRTSVAGWALALVAVFIAPVATTAAVYAALKWRRRKAEA